MRMEILDKNLKTTFTINKSKFHCFAYFINNKEQVKDILANTKKEFPDASHICYGFILDDNTYYYSDGGEPNGTAGQPIYNAIKSLKLNYCLVVVVRYFGGIKFGPGPLRQTFKDITIKTLKTGKFVESAIGDILTFEISYDKLKNFTNQFKKIVSYIEYKTDYALVDLVGSKDEILQLTKLKPHAIRLQQIIKKSS